MTSPTEILDKVYRLVTVELRATLEARETLDTRSARNARNTRSQLLPVLRDAAKLRDIDALLAVERVFLMQEREYLAEAPPKIASLANAIAELDAATDMLSKVRDFDEYASIDAAFSLPKNRIRGLPGDQARQFFRSHLARLRNLEKGRMEDSERDLVSARIRNIKVAQDIYIELQEQALASSGIHEPRARYGRQWKFAELADCA